ncbi:hypothetical protein COO60DRAFT_1529177 [Scenedesmus sp. NREL 46B-D3]|nr:hypothetical protein COO60DRAFT_1529177 [Scenedesmus sp. NREL 46B-D3]
MLCSCPSRPLYWRHTLQQLSYIVMYVCRCLCLVLPVVHGFRFASFCVPSLPRPCFATGPMCADITQGGQLAFSQAHRPHARPVFPVSTTARPDTYHCSTIIAIGPSISSTGSATPRNWTFAAAQRPATRPARLCIQLSRHAAGLTLPTSEALEDCLGLD